MLIDFSTIDEDSARKSHALANEAGCLSLDAQVSGGTTGLTQFGRALYELNIDIICANTPQAKGRVERANQTLQIACERDAASGHQHNRCGQYLCG